MTASPDEQLLERIIRVVNEHLSDASLSVELLAREVGLSRSQLHRRLKVSSMVCRPRSLPDRKARYNPADYFSRSKGMSW